MILKSNFLFSFNRNLKYLTNNLIYCFYPPVEVEIKKLPKFVF